MRSAAKLRLFNSISNSKIQNFNLFNFSTLSRRKNQPKSQNTQKPRLKKQTSLQKDENDSLFSEIAEILGAGNLVLSKISSGYSVSDSVSLDFAGNGHCTPGVCENAQEKIESKKEEVVVVRDVQVGDLTGNDDDVSDVVHRISEIVRGGNAGISMEERLNDSGYEFSSDIVVKVLKRCFKVPHLAKRFFNWVKLKNESCLTTESYNTMLYLAGEAKEFELIESLLEEMEKFSCEKDIKTWTILFMHYGKAKLVGKALLTFEKMKRLGFEPDAESYRWLIRVLCQCGKGEIALEFYKEMVQKEFVLDNRLYTMLLNCLAGCGDIDGVYIVANDMVNISEIPEHDVYSCVLKSFCMSERIREALELIRDLKTKNLTLTSEYFEILVKGLCKAGRMVDALEIVDIMKKINAVNDVVYGALIHGYLRQNNLPRALDLFRGMKDDGIAPLTSTCTQLMQHFFDLNEYEKGCALFNEMLERGVKLDSVAYTAMIAGHVRNNSISAAWKLFKSMEEEGIKATQKCYLVFIKELCRSLNTNEMIKVLNHMQDNKIKIGEEIFQCVISYLKRKKETTKLEEVKKILQNSRHYCEAVEACGDDSSESKLHHSECNNVEPNVESLLLEPLSQSFSDEDLHKICGVLSSSKDWSVMQEVLEEFKICYTPDLVTEILRICSQHGRAALQFFSWVKSQPGYRHTTESYNMGMKVAGKGKDYKHMRNLFYEMQRNGCLVTPDTWTIMIMLYGRVGLTDIALKTFNEMKVSGLKPTASTYKYLILSLCGRKGRKVDEAIKLFKEMINTELVPDKELVEVCFDCFCQAGKLEDAKKCLDYLQKVGFTKPLSYSLLIRILFRRGKVEEALALADDVKEERSILDRYIYGSLVHGLLHIGQLDKALAKVDSMKQAGVHPTVHVYTSLIAHFCKEKQMGRALEFFKMMWQEDCYPTVVTYTALIRGYINTQNFEDARKLFLRMRLKGPFPDFKAYSMLITSFCEMGKSEAAMQLLSDMLDDDITPSTVNFRTVFFGLNREGKPHLAQEVMQLKHAVANKRKFSTS
ncbi:putative pentatricopeptide repeat-containing protein At5g06400, mitochondrial [Beta vulgaris subsp. vulgaris]|uniref:putative pentatricopeptide repeat-containing protein At5g06400, mitochondrial n=1 Tax=Beta vulgaris subsp. vulgaris TaxID=3555 RepID=UPI002037282C|nr:putative pentatricopeptide repeat-containing protein At5g06400, mitochondrial [Beta vulgaris subsp. vulgaris]